MSIAAEKRAGAKAAIKISDGRDIPMPSTYVPVLKEAGFCPDTLWLNGKSQTA
ncbi:hypothetical protein [Pacificibacter marinus]|uniref:hypothetical protein n=1 Tax=Pacificibacter marinus TaxID=658057 RepID=UPI001C07CA99|nr:hypothetical protein [Pacificibacter marinus]MBU2866890.1 hypothetical protein [Pacificibacter marinus]